MVKYSKCHDCNIGKALLDIALEYQQLAANLKNTSSLDLTPHAMGYCHGQRTLALEIVRDLLAGLEYCNSIHNLRKLTRYVA